MINIRKDFSGYRIQEDSGILGMSCWDVRKHPLFSDYLSYYAATINNHPGVFSDHHKLQVSYKVWNPGERGIPYTHNGYVSYEGPLQDAECRLVEYAERAVLGEDMDAFASSELVDASVFVPYSPPDAHYQESETRRRSIIMENVLRLAAANAWFQVGGAAAVLDKVGGLHGKGVQ